MQPAIAVSLILYYSQSYYKILFKNIWQQLLTIINLTKTINVEKILVGQDILGLRPLNMWKVFIRLSGELQIVKHITVQVHYKVTYLQ